MTIEKQKQQLQDRRDYRSALIQRREDTERKISAVEDQIRTLKAE